ncbi:hypothetical protein ACHAQH_002168 [Verticillium albo-atrum]
MSSNVDPETPKAGAWTDEERVQLLIQVILQNCGQVSLKGVKLPGRTTKAITHVYGRIKSEAQASINGGGSASDSPSASKTQSTGKKRRSSSNANGTPAAKKRAAKSATP